MFKICMIGCGDHAYRVHGPSLKAYANVTPEVELACCCDINNTAAHRFADAFGFLRCDTNYIDMLHREKPDAVVVVVPVPITYAVASEIMRMGVPLVLEKPPGASVNEARSLAKLQKETSALHRVAFNRRYMPQICKIKELFLNKQATPDYIHYTMYRVARFEPDFSTTAVHAIDVVRFIASADYSRVNFTYKPIKGQQAVSIYIDAQMINGCTVRIDICPGAGVLAETVTASTLGQTVFAELPTGETQGLATGVSQFCNGQQRNWTIKEISSNEEFYNLGGFYDETASFFDAIRSGDVKELIKDFDASVQSVEVSQLIATKEAQYNI